MLTYSYNVIGIVCISQGLNEKDEILERERPRETERGGFWNERGLGEFKFQKARLKFQIPLFAAIW